MKMFIASTEIIIPADNIEDAKGLIEDMKMNPDSWMLGELMENIIIKEQEIL